MQNVLLRNSVIGSRPVTEPEVAFKRQGPEL